MDKIATRAMIFGDFNAHHLAWSHTTNYKGIWLNEAVDRNRFVMLNTTTPTRLNIASNAIHRWSLLDTTLATAVLASKCQLTVSDQFLGSDHAIILTTLNEKFISSDPRPPSWSLRRADWEEFS